MPRQSSSVALAGLSIPESVIPVSGADPVVVLDHPPTRAVFLTVRQHKVGTPRRQH